MPVIYSLTRSNGEPWPTTQTRDGRKVLDLSDERVIFSFLQPSGYHFSPDLWRAVPKVDKGFCVSCQTFLTQPKVLSRGWWAHHLDMEMPDEECWHDIHTIGFLKACAERRDYACKLCELIWEQVGEAAALQRTSFLQDHASARVRLALVEHYRMPPNKILYQTQKIYIDFGFPETRSRVADSSLETSAGVLSPSELSTSWPSRTATGFLRLLTLAQPHIPHERLSTDSSTFSQPSQDLMKYWLSSCLNNKHGAHNFCIDATPNATTRQLPTRLLDVGTGSSVNVTLVLSTSLPSDTEYIALSHCWGKAEIPRLMDDNMKVYKRGIPMSRLPRTFHEAVLVTRALDFRYLWIDSLCIIQDSPADWAFESARMSAVYSNAVVTIAAAASTDSHTGLFSQRKPLPQVCAIQDVSQEEPEMIYIVQPQWDRHFLSTVQGNLQTRGWTFQERVRSTRIIHFGDGALAWECASRTASEFCQDWMTRSGDVYSATMLSNVWDPRKPAILDAEDTRYTITPEDPVLQWFGFVEEFSTRSLTYQSDTLVAISAIAKALAPVLEAEYKIGLWGDPLFVLCMGWVSGPSFNGLPLGPQEPSGDYVAPSWSWASMRGPVVYPFRNVNQIYEEYKVVVGGQLIEDAIEYTDQDEFMGVRSGRVTVQALSWPAQLSAIEPCSCPDGGHSVPEFHGAHRKFTPEWTLETPEGEVYPLPVDVVLDFAPELGPESKSCPVICLLSSVFHETSHLRNPDQDGLPAAAVRHILSPAPNRDRDTAAVVLLQETREEKVYHRVGVALVVGVDAELKWCHKQTARHEKITIV